MLWKRIAVVLASVLACASVLATGASAGKPDLTRVEVDETFEDEFLSDVCGVPVETHASGHEITRSFTDDRGRLLEIFTLNVSLTATSDGGTFRFRDVGADLTRITKDGVVHQIIGKLPFWFNGTAWEDPVTGEVLKQPTGPDLFESMVDKACAALAS